MNMCSCAHPKFKFLVYGALFLFGSNTTLVNVKCIWVQLQAEPPV